MTHNPHIIPPWSSHKNTVRLLHLGYLLLQFSSFLPWRSSQLFLPKYRYPPTRLYCATNRKVVGSLPASVIGIFHFDRTMALGSTQPLTEMSTRSIFWGGKGGRCVRLTTLPPSCAVVMKSGNLNFLEPSGPLQICNGTALPLPTILPEYQAYLHSTSNLTSHRSYSSVTLNVHYQPTSVVLSTYFDIAGLK